MLDQESIHSDLQVGLGGILEVVVLASEFVCDENNCNVVLSVPLLDELHAVLEREAVEMIAATVTVSAYWYRYA